MDGHKNAVCETASDSVFVINISFTRKDTYFHHALAEACDAFNTEMLDFGYTQKLEPYSPTQHQIQPPQNIHFTDEITVISLPYSCLLLLPFSSDVFIMSQVEFDFTTLDLHTCLKTAWLALKLSFAPLSLHRHYWSSLHRHFWLP